MAVVKTVSSGDPITAGWANSLVHEINTHEGLRLRGKAANSISLRSVKTDNDPAWQIKYRSGVASINAGQVYINGLLIGGNVASYNQASSASNWEDTHTYIPKDMNDLPIWYLVITCPQVVTASNVSECTCSLFLSTKTEEEYTQPTPPDDLGDKSFITIQLNSINGYNLVQLRSGTIYIEQGSGISLIAGDGIRIDTNTDNTEYTIALNLSFIAEDGITITETTDTDGQRTVTIGAEEQNKISIVGTDPITVTETTTNNVTTYIIGANITIPEQEEFKISFIGEDGITVTETTETDGQKTVTIGKTTEDLVVEQVTDPLPEEGVDGWIVTLYLPMIYVQDNLYSFKQLMRVHEGKLQVSAQKSQMIGGDGQWHNSFEAYTLSE